MTKKDYEAIALVIRSSRDYSCQENIQDLIAYGLARVMAGDNPRFDRARFLAACRGEDSRDSAGRKVSYSRA